jgi:hypothetical protein
MDLDGDFRGINARLSAAVDDGKRHGNPFLGKANIPDWGISEQRRW